MLHTQLLPTFTRLASEPRASGLAPPSDAALHEAGAARLAAGEGSREARLPSRLPRLARMLRWPCWAAVAEPGAEGGLMRSRDVLRLVERAGWLLARDTLQQGSASALRFTARYAVVQLVHSEAAVAELGVEGALKRSRDVLRLVDQAGWLLARDTLRQAISQQVGQSAGSSSLGTSAELVLAVLG